VDWLKKLTKVFYGYRYKLTYVAIAALIAAAFLYRLNNLTPGPHSDELELYQQAKLLNGSNFIENIVFLPYLVLVAIVDRLVSISQVSLRLPSVFFAVTMIPMAYYVLYVWHTRRIATLGVILLLSSSWFISLARFGTPDLLYGWGILAAITAMTLIFHHRKHMTKRLIIMGLAGMLIGLSLYVPYTAYVYLLTAAVGYKYIQRLIKEITELEIVTFLSVALLFSSPLIAALISNPEAGLTLLGLPDSSFPDLQNLLERMKDMFSHVFWRSDGNLVTNAGNLPLLGIFGAALAALGMYHYEQHRHNLRTHIVAGVFFMLILLLAIDYAPEKSAALLPVTYILIAMGAVTLLTQWYRLFPKNPFARTVGLAVIALFILANITYHNQRYFAAWARSPETKVAFSDDVILLEERLHKYDAEGVESLTIYANNPRLQRVKTWLESSRLEMNIYSYTDVASSDSQLLLVEPEFNLGNIADFNSNNYELDREVDTTSVIDPQTYRFFIEIADPN